MPKSKEETNAEWKELYQEYKDNKEDSLAQSLKKINKEADDFEKLWIAAGHAVYDKSGNLLPSCKKKELKKKN
mgnify:FL=1|tara:strand:- start:374 stop:592 length:219 start_codon:yes stop_codon:yes gene_type:complete